MTKTHTKSTTNNGICEKIYKSITFSPAFRSIRRISLSPTTTTANSSAPYLLEVPITSGSPMPPRSQGVCSSAGAKQGRKMNGGGEEGRKEAMGKRVDSLNDRVSTYINKVKLKMRTSSNVDGGN